jgi:hypothetical protein
MSNTHITVDGTIKSIRKRETRFGKPFYQIRVCSDKIAIQVDVFDPRHVAEVRFAEIGDKLAASGPGFHRGPVPTGVTTIPRGTTSITAKKLRLTRDDASRKAHAPAQQLDLFAA